MRKLILAASVAAFAIAVPAVAKPDKGGGGHGGHAQAQQGGGGQKAERGGGGGGDRHAQKTERRGGGGDRQMQKFERRGGGGQRFADFDRGERKARRAERHGGGERRFANFQADRKERRAKQFENHKQRDRDIVRMERKGHDRDRFEVRNRGGQADRRIASGGHDLRHDGHGITHPRVDHDGRFHNVEDLHRAALLHRDEFRRHSDWRDWDDGDWDHHFGDRGLPAAFVGCPPGLAKKAVPCVPPGLARNAFMGMALPSNYASNYLPLGLRDIYNDTPDYFYRWGDGYVYRVDRDDNLISALLPLIGAGYGVGQYFPNYQQSAYYVPSYYQPFYPDTPYDYYRYDDGYVYRVDAGSGMIEDVIPLLDRGYGIGQMLPAGYSYYNVPDQYRDYYYDTDDYSYRYAPGAIYQVDRDTQLITAIASLLTGGLSVGQPLPASYSAYNVPLDYRDRYYDTPDAMYRYSDGYIYRVDPTTQLITAMVQALV